MASNLIPFVKMHGLGNDFILIEKKFLNTLKPYLSQLLNRENGLSIKEAKAIEHTATELEQKTIGADQIFFYELINTMLNTVSIRIFNQDGSEATACGNGFRCLGKYFWQTKAWTKLTILVSTSSKYYTVERIADKSKKLNINDDEYTVNMREITLEDFNPNLSNIILKILKQHNLNSDLLNQLKTNMRLSRYLYAPNPHLVLFVEDNLANEQLQTIGAILETANLYSYNQGQNINFATIVNENKILLRTWERGAGLTKACGTGAIASLVASFNNYYLAKLNSAKINPTATIQMLGGNLQIALANNNVAFMQGSANLIFSGEFNSNLYLTS